MARFHSGTDLSERQQLIGGAVALLLASACTVMLTIIGIGRGLPGILVGLAAVGLFVAATLSIGTSESARV